MNNFLFASLIVLVFAPAAFAQTSDVNEVHVVTDPPPTVRPLSPLPAPRDGEYTWRDDAPPPRDDRYDDTNYDYTGQRPRRSAPPTVDRDYVYGQVPWERGEEDGPRPTLRRRQDADYDYSSERAPRMDRPTRENDRGQWDVGREGDEGYRRAARQADQVYGDDRGDYPSARHDRAYGPPRESGVLRPTTPPVAAPETVKTLDQASTKVVDKPLSGQEVLGLYRDMGANQFPKGTKVTFPPKAAIASGSNCSANQDIQTSLSKGSCLTCLADQPAQSVPIPLNSAYELDSGNWAPDGKTVAYNLKGQPGIVLRCTNLSGKEMVPDMVKALGDIGIAFAFNRPSDAQPPAAPVPKEAPAAPVAPTTVEAQKPSGTSG